MTKPIYAQSERAPAGFVTQPYGQPGTAPGGDPRLHEPNPAPNATQPLVPSAPTVNVQIKTGS